AAPAGPGKRTWGLGRPLFRLIVLRTDRPADVDTQRPDLGAQAPPGDPEDARRLDRVALRAPQDPRQHLAFHLLQRLGVDVLRTGLQTLGQEALPFRGRGGDGRRPGPATD